MPQYAGRNPWCVPWQQVQRVSGLKAAVKLRKRDKRLRVPCVFKKTGGLRETGHCHHAGGRLPDASETFCNIA